MRVLHPSDPRPLADVTLAQGTGSTLAGLRLRFEGMAWYSGLHVTYQPAAAWAWAAAALALAGMAYAFAFPWRWMRLTVRPATGGSAVHIRVGGRAMGRDDELDRVTAAIAAHLGGPSPGAEPARRTLRTGEEQSHAG